MDSSTNYHEGSDVEFYISAGVSVPFGIFFCVFTILNLFGKHLGSFGRMFLFEMDEVMGGLLGIPHYSKLEAIMIGSGAVGSWLLWVRDPLVQLVSVLGLIIVNIYFYICVVYAINARQIVWMFVIPTIPVAAIIIWRCVRFLDPIYYSTVGIVAGVGVIITIISYFIMRSRRSKCEPAISKLLAIQKFVKLRKASDPNWKMVWLEGKNKPEGFQQDG